MTKPKSVVDMSELPVRTGTIYPPALAKEVAGRSNVPLGNYFDITQFGVNITTLQPGAWSSQRHFHTTEDELAYALEGEMELVDDHGSHPFKPGMVAGFKAGNGNAHTIKNVGTVPARFLIVGSRMHTEAVTYPDVDMKYEKRDGNPYVTRKDGSEF